MYVEICIASAATFVWWFSQPGLLNNIALSTMFVCSVSTVVFNGNPLLRYDGYYILSDVLEIPNLRQKATTILYRKLGKLCMGLEEPDDPFLPKSNQFWFMLYSVAAAVYSWVVMFSILFFLFKVFQPYRLQIIGQIIGAASIASLIGRPLWSLGKFFYIPGRIDEVKKPRFYASLAIVAVVLLLIAFLPLPYHVYCSLEVEPRDAQQVYVMVPGELESVPVKRGKSVKAGDTLATLKNLDLQLEIAQLETQLDFWRAKRTFIEHQERYDDPKAAEELPGIADTIKGLGEQLDAKRLDEKRLTLVANRDGIVIPPMPVPPRPSADGKLPTWSGTPLEKKNIGAMLPATTWFCQIGDPDKFDAMLIIDQADMELVRVGQKVKIKLDELPGDTFETTITAISDRPMENVPSQLSNKRGGSVETKSDASGQERAVSISYLAKAPLDDMEGVLVTSLKGEAKIGADYHSLGWRLYRFLQHTFHFKL